VAAVLRLPEPMLARSGSIPAGRGWLFEPKLDGFRCLVCTHGRFRARSRNGWNMTSLLPELAASLPTNVQVDGELVALGARMLHGEAGIPITLFVFDVLAVEGLPTTMLPYVKRRALLEEIDVEGPCVKLVATFEDGQALFDVVLERGLEGVVAKRERDPYRPGERAWVKTKNKETRRFAEELVGVQRRIDRRRRQRAGVPPALTGHVS
jgi:bifunctional non-homologous end joining protein LigD